MASKVKRTRESKRQANSESESDDSFDMSDLEPDKLSTEAPKKRTDKAEAKKAAKVEKEAKR